VAATLGTSRVVDLLARAAFRGAYRLLSVYWFLARPDTHGVCVGVWHGREVLLIKNSYKPYFSLPGGGPHRGEAGPETGARELREEVGVHVSPDQLRAAFEIVSTEEHKRDHVRFFEIDVPSRSPITIDRREVVWAEFVDSRDALSRPLGPAMRAYLEDAVRRRGP
jgi:8-oxo-dGTP diphosphatase